MAITLSSPLHSENINTASPGERPMTRNLRLPVHVGSRLTSKRRSASCLNRETQTVTSKFQLLMPVPSLCLSGLQPRMDSRPLISAETTSFRGLRSQETITARGLSWARMIKHSFWHSLTRRIDGEDLEIICADPKNRAGRMSPRIYVPHGEPAMADPMFRGELERQARYPSTGDERGG